MAAAENNRSFLTGGGEMGALMRAHDWSTSPLGHPRDWPQSLRSIVTLMTANRHLMFVAWGPDLAFLYNDGYRPVFGAKHPWALGRPFREVWAEIWDDIEPLVNTALGGEATWSENLHLVMERNGYPEDCWFTFSYSPVRDESGAVAGLFCAGTETTDTVLAERRQAYRLALDERLRDLADPRAVMDTAVELLGRQLGADRVGYGEVQADGATVVLHSCFAEGVEALEGSFQLDGFGPAAIARQREGLTEWSADVTQDPDQDPAIWAAIDVRAFASVPLIRDGRFAASLYVNFRGPHVWKPDEIALIEETAARTWSAVARARVEAALRESEDRFRSLVTATANVVYRMGPDWREMRRLDGAGFVVDTKAPTTDWVETYIPADERPRLRQAIGQAIRAKSVFELEHRVLRLDGTVGWTFSRAIPLLDAGGEITQWFGAASDVTARVKGDQSFTRLFQASPAPFLVVAPDAPRFTITQVNDAYLAATMRTRDELIGRGIFEAFPDNPDDATATGVNSLRASLERVLATREPDGLPGLKYDVAHPDGGFEERWWSPVNSPVLDERGEVEALIHNAVDVTEDRRAATALRESEERYRQIVEGAEDFAMIRLDARGIITGWNTGAERLLGYSEADALGQDGAVFFTPEDRARGAPEREMSVALDQGRAVNERWHRRKDGSRFWGSGLMTPLEDDGGFLKIFRDRTTEHAAEAALHESERELRFTLKAGRFGAWALDLVTGELTTSETCRTNFGRGPHTAFTYADLRQAVHPDDQARMAAAVERSVATGADYDIEYRIVTPNGEVRWVLIRARPSYDADGTPLKMAGVSIDVTDRKRDEARIRELNETLEHQVAERTADRNALWQLSSDVMLRCRFDGTITAVNPAWQTVLGWDEGSLLGANLFDFLHPDDTEHTIRGAKELSEGVGHTRFDNRYRHKDGSYRWISWSTRPAENLINAVGRDVTADKEREAELALAQEALRQSQKMEAMGSLTGGVAHDFNNLLTPIVGSLDMLQRKGLGGEREQRLIAGAVQSADRAKTLVQRLLAFARRQPLQPTAVDLAPLVRGMADLVSSTTGPQIRVVVDAADDLPPAKADPNQLEMAILNLAVNARDAMPDGGTLRISVDAETVGRQHRADIVPGRYLRLSVADTGSGMDEATLRRAIEPFFSTKGVGKGTGLGLSMAHGLVSQLGGALTIRSTPAVGTNVELWLPQSAAAVVSPEVAAGPSPVAKGSGTALLVDDEDLVRLSTADMLIELGYSVVEASSAEEALKLVDCGLQPDLLVTDHLMPGMSGTELARTLQASRPGIKVLVVSGYAEAEGIESDVPRLTKPFRNADLAESLATLG